MKMYNPQGVEVNVDKDQVQVMRDAGYTDTIAPKPAASPEPAAETPETEDSEDTESTDAEEETPTRKPRRRVVK